MNRQLLQLFYCLFLCLVGSATVTLAQSNTKTISGIVKASDTTPLIGVSVMIKGTTNGTITDTKGEFLIPTTSENTTLVFSYIGYTTLEKTFTSSSKTTQVEIILNDDSKGLEEVVVIGYGTAKRKDLTGAVTSVQTKQLEKEAPRSVQDLLRGNAAGMIIGQGNSAKADASLTVRGSGTLKAGNSPLIVLDGVIFNGSLTDINPNDIQSVDILKDASATAVFGAKAANGVVLISTKRGSTGKPTISLNVNTGVVANANWPRVMTGEEFLDYRYDYQIGRRTSAYHQQYPQMFVDPRKLEGVDQLTWYNYNQNTPVTSVTEEMLVRNWLSRLELKAPEIENYLANRVTNWQDQVFHKGFQQDYTISASNRSDHSSYYLSLNYVDREGIIVGNRYKNLRTRVNLESKIAPFLKIGTNANFAVRNEGFLQADWGQSSTISPYGANEISDLTSSFRRLPTGDPTPVNPFYDNLFRDRKDTYNTLNATVYGIISLPLGIEFQTNYTPNFTWREYYNHESSKNIEWAARGGSSERTFQKTFNWQIDNVLRWKKQFGSHGLEATFLQNAEKGQYWSTKATTYAYSPSDILSYHRLQAGTVPLNESNDTYYTGDALMGRLFYSFKEKYMITASLRRDGYSAFGSQNPRATFPAIALGWEFTSENFMKATSNWLNYGKLRLSWGKNGNRDIGQYEALSDMTSGQHPYINQAGTPYLYSQLYVNRMANLGLRWENKSSYNFGLDFAVLNNKIKGAIDAYTASTTDLLVDRALPEIIGFNSVAANLGLLRNNGFETSLSSEIIKRSDFSWNTQFVFMLNRRKILKLYGDMVNVLDGSGNIIGEREADDIKNQWFIGRDPDQVWSYQRDGIWQLDEAELAAKYGNQPGDFKYIDQNGDGVMTNDDRVFQQYRSPRFRWSWRNDFDYKNFNLSLFFYSNWGQVDGFNRAGNNSSFPDRTTDYHMPRWTPDNPINDYARIGSRNIGTNWIQRSFIRLDNIALSYSIPKSILGVIKAQSLRVSASVRNAAVWAPHWKFGDPESGGFRIDQGDESSAGQPTPRTYNLSLNFTL